MQGESLNPRGSERDAFLFNAKRSWVGPDLALPGGEGLHQLHQLHQALGKTPKLVRGLRETV